VLAAKGTRPRRPRFPSCTFVADLQDTAWLRRLRGCFGPPLMVLAFFCGVMQSVDARICWQVPPVRALKAASAGCTLCRRGQERGWMLPLKRDLSNLHHVSVGAQLAMPCVAGLARCEMGIRLYFSHSQNSKRCPQVEVRLEVPAGQLAGGPVTRTRTEASSLPIFHTAKRLAYSLCTVSRREMRIYEQDERDDGQGCNKNAGFLSRIRGSALGQAQRMRPISPRARRHPPLLSRPRVRHGPPYSP